MTIPSYGGSGSFVNGVGTVALTPSLMSATAGSIFILQVHHNHQTAQAGASYFFPAGFESMFTASATGLSARQFLYMSVADGTETTSDTLTIATSGGSSGIRHQAVVHKFVNAATTWESSSFGSGSTSVVSDAGVTTLGSSRLAVNMMAAGFFNASSAFTGETGGDWSLMYISATDGFNGHVSVNAADMASSGTINGGAYSLATSAVWLVSGFALISDTPAAPAAGSEFSIFESHVFSSPMFGRF